MHSSRDLSSIARKRGLGKKLFPMQQSIIGKKYKNERIHCLEFQ